MTQSQAEFAPAVCTIEEIADALGISKSDLDLRYPIKLAKTGNWHLMVGVKSLEVLNGIEYDTVKLSQILSRAPIVTAHVFCDEEKDIFHARNFGPTFGIPEDPATGSAAGVFGAYLANEKLLDGDHAKFLVLQGESMGRTSHINIAVSSSNGQFDQVEITGTAVPSFKLVAQHAAIPALLASYLQYVPPRG